MSVLRFLGRKTGAKIGKISIKKEKNRKKDGLLFIVLLG
jgi:hypothetical protein